MAALFKPRKHRAKHKYLKVEYKDGKWKYHYYERPLSRKKKITGSGKVNKSDLTVDEIQAVRIIKNEFDTALHGSWGKKKKKKSSLSSNAHKAKSKKVRVPKMSQLQHNAKGSQKQNHKYLDRKWLNGKWQYIYGNAKKAASNAKKEFQAQTNSNSRVNTLRRAKLNKAKNDVSNKIASGRSKVNSIIDQLKRQASGKVAGYKSAKQSKERQKRLNQINKQKQASAKAFNKALKRTHTSMRNAAYERNNIVENYMRGTSDYKSASQIVKENEKKYKKRAQQQKRSKNKIAREQAVGKAKKAVTTAATNVVQTAKNTKNSYTNPYSRRNTLRNAKKRNKKKS